MNDDEYRAIGKVLVAMADARNRADRIWAKRPRGQCRARPNESYTPSLMVLFNTDPHPPVRFWRHEPGECINAALNHAKAEGVYR